MRLIVNADDFGLTAGVNRAIIAAHRAGSVTSATLMVTMPAAAEAAALARTHPQLGVGLHVNLTLGAPAAPVATVPSLLAADGRFHPRPRAERLALLGRLRRGELAVELEAQYRRCLALGITPTHLDSHQHLHLFPAVFDTLAAFCVEHGLPLRMPWPPRLRAGGVRRRLRGLALAALVRRNVSRWQGRLAMNAAFASVFDLAVAPAALSLESYRRLLAGCSASPCELMVHPAEDDAELRQFTRITATSAREAELLATPAFAALVRELGWQPAHYGTAWGPLRGR